jgi:hypothetical protein
VLTVWYAEEEEEEEEEEEREEIEVEVGEGKEAEKMETGGVSCEFVLLGLGAVLDRWCCCCCCCCCLTPLT